jgi:LuxR family quorum-sensing system transcriptional regulator SolR
MAAKILKYVSPVLSDALLCNITKDHVRLGGREIEVLKWIMAGKSAWETGAIMAISERTVRHHLTNIYKKLDVVNSTQAVAEAIRSGIL